MNCPFCDKQIKHLAIHIKEKHSKKFNLLEESKPELYRRLQRELKVHEMIESKNPILFTLKVKSKTQYYEYHCARCGKCCHIWEIEIQKEDVKKWEASGREELLEYIQLYPKDISVMKLGLIKKFAEIEIPEISIDHVTIVRNIFNTTNFNADVAIKQILSKEDKAVSEETREKIKNLIDIQTRIIGYYLTGDVKELDENIIKNIDNLRNFILNNHNYLGEPKVDRWGQPIEDPIMNQLKAQLPHLFDEENGVFKGKIPHWFLGTKYGPRAILSPKSYQAMKEGWNRRLSYYLIYELVGGCGFQKDNLCSIHEYKPTACRLFPSNRMNLDPTADKHFLESCKGLKRLL